MSLDLADYKVKARTAVKQFWTEWKKSSTKKPMVGGMDGFIDLIADIVHANGLTRANLLQQGQLYRFRGISHQPNHGILWW